MPNAPRTTWGNVTQSPSMGLDEHGRVVEGYKVMFKTGAGNTGSVFIPASRYTPDNVRAAIAAHAAVLDQVSALSDTAPGS